MNCWEHKKCGREASGKRINEFGVCPAYTERRMDGVHSGYNAGRSCWVVAGTFCGGKIQGSFAEKEKACIACEFYKVVRKEEGDRFKNIAILMDKLKASA